MGKNIALAAIILLFSSAGRILAAQFNQPLEDFTTPGNWSSTGPGYT